ncbi:O-antigen ligase family protein [Paenibacillus sp. FSL L8-0463]|uniref:O-antigen ligase family protein n=1 Tax=Paenibacillus sp. FSL L8-0463 TaxID=2954687 RepID=UPI003119A5C3
MINVLYFALLIVHAVSVTFSIPGFGILGASALFFFYSYKKFKVRSNKTTAIVQLMCYSIPISWRNIFGGEYGDLPISWFYILGAILAIHLISIRNDIKLSSSRFATAFIVFAVTLYSVIPLLNTNSTFFSQGVGQFIILTFHNIIILVAIMKGNILSKENMTMIEKSYATAGFIAAIGIITQYIVFKFGGTTIGLLDYYLNRQSFRFLFSDVSHATLYLATTAFLSIQLMSKAEHGKLRLAIIPLVTLIGAAITSARTGLVVFFAVYMLYIFIEQKGFSKKLRAMILGVVGLYGAYSLFRIVRPQTDLAAILTDSSSRGVGYEAALNLFYQHPWLGYGFSKDYLAQTMNQPIPHLSFLQYMVHGGIVYTLMIFGVIFMAFIFARRYRMNVSWLILLTVLGTCLIPDIFSTRYITLLMLLVFLKSREIDEPLRSDSPNSLPSSRIAGRNNLPGRIPTSNGIRVVKDHRL